MGHGLRLVRRHCSLKRSLTTLTVDLVPERKLVINLLMGQEKLTAALSPVSMRCSIIERQNSISFNEFLMVEHSLLEKLGRLVETF